LHGWRELAKEIGVITIGVAIALGGEQVVDWLHRRAEVFEARRALKAEVAANAGAARFDLEYDRCLSGWLDRFAAGEPPDFANSPVVRPLRPGAAVWDVAKIGAAAHMPFEERLAYSRFYNGLTSLNTTVDATGTSWMQLADDLPSSTGPGAPRDSRFLGKVYALRLVGAVQIQVAGSIIRQAKAMGVEPEPVTSEQRELLAKFCKGPGISMGPV
jgi:hypothetical protein